MIDQENVVVNQNWNYNYFLLCIYTKFVFLTNNWNFQFHYNK